MRNTILLSAIALSLALSGTAFAASDNDGYSRQEARGERSRTHDEGKSHEARSDRRDHRDGRSERVKSDRHDQRDADHDSDQKRRGDRRG